MGEQCDEEIYKNGTGVVVLEGRSKVVEAIVQTASMQSGIKMDWHYVAGRAMVKTLGDAAEARKAIESVTPRIIG